jgi:Dockerin type I repeat.
VSVSGNDLIVDLTNVSNQQVLTLSTSGGTLSPVTVPIGFLVGDTNGNRAVSAGDVAQTKARSGLPVTSANFRSDVNANGSINAGDIAQVKAQSGTSIP